MAADHFPTQPSQPATPHDTHGTQIPVDTAADAHDGSAAIPQIPGYDLLSVLGRGGMGVVYLARHILLDRLVALKMVTANQHASADQLLRFVREAEAVAKLTHPHIVPVYDAGRHDGLPYLAMEYLPGGTLAERLQNGPLPGREAAPMMEKIARGIAYCHSQNILHRDLKPGNILLAADGTPKVADFGLAKRLELDSNVTRSGAVLGTPNYMAPEQAQGESNRVGPAADIYALGAVLYALLTGRPPFQGPTPMDTYLQVLSDEPVAPRRLTPSIPPDLETICMKCLNKDPARRYESAAAFADDLECWLDGRPILARPAGALERGWKWVRRNRTVAVAGTLTALALLSGSVVSTWQALRARQAEGQAELERDVARDAELLAQERELQALLERQTAVEINDFLQEILAQSSAQNQATASRGVDRELTVKEAMNRAAQRLDGRFPNRPLVEASLRRTIGWTYRQLGEIEAAKTHLTRAAELYRQYAPPTEKLALQVEGDLGVIASDVGDLAAAESQYRKTLAVALPALGATDDLVLTLRQNLARALADQEKYAEAEPLYREVLQSFRQQQGENGLDVIGVSCNLGRMYLEWNRLADAELLLAPAATTSRQHLGADHPLTLVSANNLGRVYERTGRGEQAEPLYRFAWENTRRVMGPEHSDTGTATLSLALFYRRQNRPAESVPLLLEVVPLCKKQYGPDDLITGEVLLLLVEDMLKLGDYANVEPFARECLALWRKGRPKSQGEVKSLGHLCASLIGQGKNEAAEPNLLDWYATIKERDASLPPTKRTALRQIGEEIVSFYLSWKKPDEAAKWRKRITDDCPAVEAAPPPRLGQ